MQYVRVNPSSKIWQRSSSGLLSTGCSRQQPASVRRANTCTAVESHGPNAVIIIYCGPVTR
jgi:hypothetical protein